MRYFLLTFHFLASIYSCTDAVYTKNVALSSLLDDNSSKVWLVNKAFENGKNTSPENTSFREVLIFYASRNVYLQPLNSIGNSEGEKCVYEVGSNERLLTLTFKDEVWIFEVEFQSANKLILHPLPKSDCQFEMELIPLPEL